MARFAPIKSTKPESFESAYKYGFSKPTDDYVYKSPKGLSKRIVEEISYQKQEPEWMRRLRLEALKVFESKPVPAWGGDLSGIDWQDIHYYLRPIDAFKRKWSEVPKEIKDTFDKIGIPEAERKYLAGVSSQYDSETVYDSLKKIWEKKGVVFLGMDEGLKRYPDLVKEYFGKVIPMADNKLAALNWAAWSGGSFVYVPKGVKVDMPLQAYFRINAKNIGQFERTLIIADKGSYVHYVEGCTAPIYTTDSLHAAVVEIIVKKGARVRYTTIQNWSTNVYNLVTKRMRVEEEAVGEWIDGNLGSKLTMKFPSVYLMGRKARGEVLSIAYAGPGQHQDAGGKAIHLASETSSRIISKSISKAGGRTSYRGLVSVSPGATNSRVYVSCDALLMDEQ